MISQEEYQLAYNLYIEGRILESTISSYELKQLTESSEILEEGVSDSIRNFINKIIKGIQGAWDKFKGNISKTKLKYSEKDIRDAINKYEPHITVDNYIEYDTDIINNVNIQTFNYESMKEDLDSIQSFMKKYYSSIYSDEDKSIYNNIKNKSIKSKSDKMDIKKEHLNKMLDYLIDYEKFRDKLEDEIKRINSASKAGDYIARMSSQNESTNITPSDRREILAKTIKSLEDQGLDPKIMNRDKGKWIETGDSGHFGGGLCITNLTKDVDKYTYVVNKLIKPLGGKLTPDNYGTAFLKTMNSKPISEVNSIESTMRYYFTEEESDQKPKVISTIDNIDKDNTNDTKTKEDDVAKKVQNYFKCVSQILSAQMKLSREIYSFYKSVVDSFMSNVKKNKSNEDNKNKEETTDSNSSDNTSQVEL